MFTLHTAKLTRIRYRCRARAPRCGAASEVSTLPRNLLYDCSVTHLLPIVKISKGIVYYEYLFVTRMVSDFKFFCIEVKLRFVVCPNCVFPVQTSGDISAPVHPLYCVGQSCLLCQITPNSR